ncbi:hypothetical protein NDU88_000919 [Pleurodeles waltl]|uniref:Uncharacterized protein n=1 Tax=Pleurodeles waltl TaxID=8319 RepID=A0AAV7UUQ4_PLEWA|nr:hypothetical protein NDU88_000919 [Pleurodeles waltl]
MKRIGAALLSQAPRGIGISPVGEAPAELGRCRTLPEIKRCETAAAGAEEAEARHMVRSPLKGGERALPTGDRGGRNGGHNARSSWRNRKRGRPLRGQPGAARPRCEPRWGPRPIDTKVNATGGTGAFPFR